MGDINKPTPGNESSSDAEKAAIAREIVRTQSRLRDLNNSLKKPAIKPYDPAKASHGNTERSEGMEDPFSASAYSKNERVTYDEDKEIWTKEKRDINGKWKIVEQRTVDEMNAERDKAAKEQELKDGAKARIEANKAKLAGERINEYQKKHGIKGAMEGYKGEMRDKARGYSVTRRGLEDSYIDRTRQNTTAERAREIIDAIPYNYDEYLQIDERFANIKDHVLGVKAYHDRLLRQWDTLVPAERRTRASHLRTVRENLEKVARQHRIMEHMRNESSYRSNPVLDEREIPINKLDEQNGIKIVIPRNAAANRADNNVIVYYPHNSSFRQGDAAAAAEAGLTIENVLAGYKNGNGVEAVSGLRVYFKEEGKFIVNGKEYNIESPIFDPVFDQDLETGEYWRSLTHPWEYKESYTQETKNTPAYIALRQRGYTSAQLANILVRMKQQPVAAGVEPLLIRISETGDALVRYTTASGEIVSARVDAGGVETSMTNDEMTDALLVWERAKSIPPDGEWHAADRVKHGVDGWEYKIGTDGFSYANNGSIYTKFDGNTWVEIAPPGQSFQRQMREPYL